jgi:diadenosine tetraphosphate (Ap4A) HIT family hydrolase
MGFSPSECSDEQLKLFLARVHSHHLAAYLSALSPANRERLLRLLSPASSELIRKKLSQPMPTGRVARAEQVLEQIVHGDGPCVFCQIFAGASPASYVYRDDQIAVLMDLYPVTTGHLLVLPKQHTASLADVPWEAASAMMKKAHELGQALMRSDLGCDGFNLFLADGGAAGQEIFHTHLHVIPRYHGDGFGLVLPPGYPREAPRAELDQMAERIKSYLT